ncbi:guanylate-binding protein 4-like [Ruditapes philippinarum]|uniref:guanylate-binding protein 4-like n=1 Tax=Ruditapes philippinarum TaxID=129788 RepID=UPI00295ACE7C|nr:guanylate-binding protein 4-like [Ruditapes philippinarum]
MADKIKEKPSGRSLEDMEIFKHPMCLISSESVEDVHGEEIIKMEEKQEVLNQLKEIDLPMVIVAVVGQYRTGKSYLMNLLAESTTGFALGDMIESKTKGIWVWCKMHPTMSDTVLLLLDTEGLGDVEKGDPSHDNKIFTLATLLCNCLVYNMKGAFDNEAVSKLTYPLLLHQSTLNLRRRTKQSFICDVVKSLQMAAINIKKIMQMLPLSSSLLNSLSRTQLQRLVHSMDMTLWIATLKRCIGYLENI